MMSGGIMQPVAKQQSGGLKQACKCRKREAVLITFWQQGLYTMRCDTQAWPYLKHAARRAAMRLCFRVATTILTI
eukprot:363670-Chlamydomonas_euryale.AAC.7